MELTTTNLNSHGGHATVLAKKTATGFDAVTYVNVSQATKKRDALRAAGIDCEVTGRYPFFIHIDAHGAYTIETRAYDNVWMPRFSFNAKDDRDADRKAFGWARYQGMLYPADVRIRPATAHEAANWIQNEWVS